MVNKENIEKGCGVGDYEQYKGAGCAKSFSLNFDPHKAFKKVEECFYSFLYNLITLCKAQGVGAAEIEIANSLLSDFEEGWDKLLSEIERLLNTVGVENEVDRMFRLMLILISNENIDNSKVGGFVISLAGRGLPVKVNVSENGVNLEVVGRDGERSVIPFDRGASYAVVEDGGSEHFDAECGAGVKLDFVWGDGYDMKNDNLIAKLRKLAHGDVNKVNTAEEVLKCFRNMFSMLTNEKFRPCFDLHDE